MLCQLSVYLGLGWSGLLRGHTQLTNCQGKIKYFLQLLNCNNAQRVQFRKKYVLSKVWQKQFKQKLNSSFAIALKVNEQSSCGVQFIITFHSVIEVCN